MQRLSRINLGNTSEMAMAYRKGQIILVQGGDISYLCFARYRRGEDSMMTTLRRSALLPLY